MLLVESTWNKLCEMINIWRRGSGGTASGQTPVDRSCNKLWIKATENTFNKIWRMILLRCIWVWCSNKFCKMKIWNFLECKSQIFFIGAKMRGVETEWQESWWRHWGWDTSFAGPGGNSANPEARRSFCWDHGASAPPPSGRGVGVKVLNFFMEYC